MTTTTLHPLAADYLQRLRDAGRDLPADRRQDLMAEIEAYLCEALPPGSSDQAALEVIERLGPPGEIAEAEQPAASARVERRSWHEWAAVILLPLGGFILGVGWLAGVALLWSSRLWTTRDKLIGTLIVPGGIAAVVPVLVLAHVGSGTQICTRLSPGANPATGTLITRGAVHCAGAAGPSGVATAWLIVLAVLLVLGAMASAVYLARRAMRNASSLADSSR